jgi:hypothetical protein
MCAFRRKAREIDIIHSSHIDTLIKGDDYTILYFTVQSPEGFCPEIGLEFGLIVSKCKFYVKGNDPPLFPQ